MRLSDLLLTDDFETVLNAEFIPWEQLRNSTILITGATGLIGSTLVRVINCANKKWSLDLRILAVVRNEKRARERLSDVLNEGMIDFVTGEVENLPVIAETVDYIIHGASKTASRDFVQNAVETIETSVLGTINLLRLAKEKRVKGFVYLSSMEVYGYPERGHKVKENEIGAFTPLDLRNSYPISKIASESLCCAYAREYNVPATICRLTQTFGPDANYDDTRFFAYIGRCAKEKRNIVLKTRGETERSYLYTADAVSAILAVMLKGEFGKAYNVADRKTYCSIAETAEKVAEYAGIKVEYDIQDEKRNGFPKTLYMDLDTEAIEQLGWNCLVDG